MTNGSPPPVPAAAPPKKKGLPPLAWVGIGCGVVLILSLLAFFALGAFVFTKGKDMVQEATGVDSVGELVDRLEDDPARTAAELAIRMNPELDLVETDADEGTVTFRNKKTGEVATLDFEEIAQGRFSVTTEEGEYSIDASEGATGGVTFKGPEGETRFGSSANLDQVPDWVPVYPGAGEVVSAYHSTTASELSGAVSCKTTDGAQEVVDYYAEYLEENGYEVTNQSMSTAGQGAFGGISGTRGDETLNVAIVQQGGESQVTINYIGKRK